MLTELKAEDVACLRNCELFESKSFYQVKPIFKCEKKVRQMYLSKLSVNYELKKLAVYLLPYSKNLLLCANCIFLLS